MKRNLLFFVCFIILISCTSITDQNQPDLIISNIEYYKTDFDPLDASWLYHFTVQINNIGKSSTNSHLYLLNTRTDEDLQLNRFTHGQLINYNNLQIQPGNTLVDSTLDRIKQPFDLVLFKIAAKGDTTKNGMELNYAEESNYENNFYELNIEN